MNNWARVLQAKGDYSEAQKGFQSALNIVQHSSAPVTWPAAQITSNLGLLDFDRGDYASAERYARQAMDIRRKLGGEQTPVFASSLIELAEDRLFQGDPVGAEPLLRQALEINRKRFWPGHPSLVSAEVRLGEALLALDKAHEAAPLLQEAVASIHARSSPLPAWQLSEAESAYGACLKNLGRSREGDTLLRQSRPALSSDPRPVFRSEVPDRLRKIGSASHRS